MIDTEHLTASEVASIAAGTADPLDADRWLSHLDECQTCSDRFQSQLDATSIEDLLRDAMSEKDPYPDEAGFNQLSTWIDDGLATQRDRQHSLQMQFPHEIGNYELIRVIGCGGMGVVYEAKQRWLNRTVAIKLLRTDQGIDQNSLHQFTREFEAVGRLDHPGIVRAIDAGCSHGRAFLVMELVDGLDLEKIRRYCGVLSEPDAIEIAMGATVGLAHAHRNGVIHRDVKPSNLMIGRDADGTGVSVRLMDLGLGQVESALTPDSPTKVFAGTKGYQAPEQIYTAEKGSPPNAAAPNGLVDQRADIYSLGATVLSLTTKLQCGQWAAEFALDSKHLSTGLRELTAAMLSPLPQDRPETMAEVESELQRLRDSIRPGNLAALLAAAKSKSEGNLPNDEGFWSILTDRALAQTMPVSALSTRRPITSKVKDLEIKGPFAVYAALLLALFVGLVWMQLPDRTETGNLAETLGNENLGSETDSEQSVSANSGAAATTPILASKSLSQQVAHEVVRLGGNWETTDKSGETLEFDKITLFPDFPVDIDYIILGQTHANDQTLDLIVGLKHLKGIVLVDTDVTDEGVKKLAEMKTLEHVYLYGTAVSDESVVALVRLPNLSKLTLGDTAITNRSLEILENSQTLQRLTIQGTRADVGCIKSVGTMTGLEDLDVRGINLADESLSPLMNLRNLREIDLARTDVSDDGIQRLMALPKLRLITTDCDQISAAEANELMEQYPRVRIMRDPDE